MKPSPMKHLGFATAAAALCALPVLAADSDTKISPTVEVKTVQVSSSSNGTGEITLNHDGTTGTVTIIDESGVEKTIPLPAQNGTQTIDLGNGSKASLSFHVNPAAGGAVDPALIKDLFQSIDPQGIISGEVVVIAGEGTQRISIADGNIHEALKEAMNAAGLTGAAIPQIQMQSVGPAVVLGTNKAEPQRDLASELDALRKSLDEQKVLLEKILKKLDR